jgi:peptidoglycan/xylan/chitin deacetylase (PgdA/CDA1 family)
LRNSASVPFVLCYHAVSETWDDPLAVRAETLERQVAAAIRRGWKPAAASDVVAGSPRALHVTFDDGYRSILGAIPSLERLGIRPTVFVCTDYANDGRPLDVPLLDHVPAARRNELATLRWDELRELAERGIEIGSHTRTHPNLRELSTGGLSQELTASRDRIESELDRPCRYLAYPFGQFDARVRDAVDRAGYEAAFGLDVGPLGGRFGLTRVEPSRRDGSLGIRLKGSAAWPPLSRVSRRIRGPVGRLQSRK